jgi:anti-anti-sigma regulatory factor
VKDTFDISVETSGETATVFANDYLNKLSGERIERECRRQLDAGVKMLVVNFAETEIVNSIGVSILLGVIDAAQTTGAQIVFPT